MYSLLEMCLPFIPRPSSIRHSLISTFCAEVKSQALGTQAFLELEQSTLRTSAALHRLKIVEDAFLDVVLVRVAAGCGDPNAPHVIFSCTHAVNVDTLHSIHAGTDVH